jgi:hypothetical protein
MRNLNGRVAGIAAQVSCLHAKQKSEAIDEAKGRFFIAREEQNRFQPQFVMSFESMCV